MQDLTHWRAAIVRGAWQTLLLIALAALMGVVVVGIVKLLEALTG